MSLTLTQKRKVAKDLIKSVNEKVIEAVAAMPPEWDAVEIKAYVAKQLEDADVTFALRGNTARGRAFTRELTYNAGL